VQKFSTFSWRNRKDYSLTNSKIESVSEQVIIMESTTNPGQNLLMEMIFLNHIEPKESYIPDKSGILDFPLTK
jgi:hypothetical protein